MALKIMKLNPCLESFASDISLRVSNFKSTKDALLKNGTTLADFANGHHFYGFHRTEEGWFYREWAPAAEKMFLTGDFCGWDRYRHPMQNVGNGVFEVFLPGKDALQEGQRVMVVVVHNGQELERIPVYATRVRFFYST